MKTETPPSATRRIEDEDPRELARKWLTPGGSMQWDDVMKTCDVLAKALLSETRPMNDSEKRNDELNDLSGPGIRKT